MPLYDLECENCKRRIAIIRTMQEHEVPPSEEEQGHPRCFPEPTHSWKRIILGSPSVLKSWAWSKDGSKGNW